jgi:hypothetical protein
MRHTIAAISSTRDPPGGVWRNGVTNKPAAKFERKYIIDYLVERKFGRNKEEDFPSISRWLTKPATIDSFFEGNELEKVAYRSQLTDMSIEKVDDAARRRKRHRGG